MLGGDVTRHRAEAEPCSLDGDVGDRGLWTQCEERAPLLAGADTLQTREAVPRPARRCPSLELGVLERYG